MLTLADVARWTERNFWRRSVHRSTSSGATHAGLPVVLDAGGKLDASLIQTHTGDVTGTTALTIANDAVTYAKMQNVSATDKVLGRATAGAGDVEEIAMTAAGRALVDDASAMAQRTTLGLGTMAVEAATAFLRLLGVAGGQTAYGGTAAGESATIEGTSHATKGPVNLNSGGGGVVIGSGNHAGFQNSSLNLDFATAIDGGRIQAGGAVVKPLALNPSGGNVGVHGSTAPEQSLTVLMAAALNGEGVAVKAAAASGAGSQPAFSWLDNAGTKIWYSYLNVADSAWHLTNGTYDIVATSAGLFGIRVTPQGIFHAHDGTSGWLKKSFTSQTFASRVAVIPNGTGDMLYACGGTAVVRTSAGGFATTAITNLIPGGSITLYTDGGTNVLLLEGLDTAGANNGAISIRRSAGSLSYIVSLDIHWL